MRRCATLLLLVLLHPASPRAEQHTLAVQVRGSGGPRPSARALETILLTHLHTDHAVELPSFATVRSLDGSGTASLRVIGPDQNARFPSTRAFVAALLGPGGASRYVRHFGAELGSDADPARREADRDRQGTSPRRCPAVGYRIEHGGRE